MDTKNKLTASAGRMTRLVRLVRRQLCKIGIHDKRTGASVQIRGDVWYITEEYRCRRCSEKLGEKSCPYPPNDLAQLPPRSGSNSEKDVIGG